MSDKFCVDCRYSKPTEDKEVYLCQVDSKLNLVTGERQYKYCSVMRMEFQPCGLSGKLYEEAEAEAVNIEDIFPNFPSISG
jgi:hypothetical protein